jgi:single-stranded-DNA-specific exonuclease
VLSKPAWTVNKSSFAEAEDLLMQKFGIYKTTAKCLINRGFKTPESVKKFLEPQLGNLDIPYKMADLSKAAKRISDAVVSRQRIGVFGDYDVDGLTSASLMCLFLQETGVFPEVQIADRFSGGYGLSIDVVKKFSSAGIKLLLVLDCGTSDHEAIDMACSLGLDVIVVDHHRIDSSFPNAYAFVNPQRHDCGFEDKQFAAVGLTFYVCAAAKTELFRAGYLTESTIDLRNYLDLVALGTIADVVSLTKNNRIMASIGLKILSRDRRPGMEALINSARIRAKNLQSSHISFQLAPRINAAGRLASAEDAFKLLVSDNLQDAGRYAAHLEEYTIRRREIEEQVTKDALKQARLQKASKNNVLVVSGKRWHKGVIGIVAARLCEEFCKPAYVIGFDGETGTGSARGQGQINLYSSLNDVSDLLIRYGGHRDAAGFTVSANKLDEFIQRINSYADKNMTEVETGKVVCDDTLIPAQLTPELLSQIQMLGPFGSGNPEPVFNIIGLDVLSAKVVGTDHLKLELKTPSGSVAAFGPHMGRFHQYMPHMINVAASIAVDEWRGENYIELRLVAPPARCLESDIY